MNFIYRRGLLRGKPGQKATVQVEDGETLELDVGPATRLVRIVLDGPDARAVRRQISRLLDFADAVTELSRGLSHAPAR